MNNTNTLLGAAQALVNAHARGELNEDHLASLEEAINRAEKSAKVQLTPVATLEVGRFSDETKLQLEDGHFEIQYGQHDLFTRTQVQRALAELTERSAQACWDVRRTEAPAFFVAAVRQAATLITVLPSAKARLIGQQQELLHD